jgi:hypothetical protein
MTEQDVTGVTRNDKYAEVKVVLDLLIWVGAIYFVTHPDAFDRLGDAARNRWRGLVHYLSVWTARQDIRSLPETEDQ